MKQCQFFTRQTNKREASAAEASAESEWVQCPNEATHHMVGRIVDTHNYCREHVKLIREAGSYRDTFEPLAVEAKAA